MTPNNDARTRIVASIQAQDVAATKGDISEHPSLVLDYFGSSGESLLHIASKAGSADIVHILLQAGASPNIEDLNNKSPLHYSKNLQTTSLLLEYGAQASAVTSTAETPLHTVRCVKSLKAICAKADSAGFASRRDANGSTPLHYAEGEESVKFLSSLSPDAVSCRNGWGHTPLHIAISKSNWKTVRALLIAGSPASLLTREGWSPLQLADNVRQQIIETPKLWQSHQMMTTYLSLWVQASNSTDNDVQGVARRVDSVASWMPLASVSRNPHSSLSQATGLPEDIVRSIVEDFLGPFMGGSVPATSQQTTSTSLLSTSGMKVRVSAALPLVLCGVALPLLAHAVLPVAATASA